MKKVLIFGSFDIIHPGHLFLINEAKKLGEVYVCLALDETIKKVKDREPYSNLELRIKNLESRGVKALPGDMEDRLKVLRQVKPDIVLLGHDQKHFVDQLEDYVAKEKLKFRIERLEPFKSDLFSSSKIRKVLEDPQAGFVLIDKPSGEPSMHTVSVLRKKLDIKKIGFAGTLDPLASGLLICGISKATTLIDWFHFFPKTYEVTAKLGYVSDTFDSEGKVEQVKGLWSQVSEVGILKVLRKFIGEIEQEPPMFSAKKHRGKKLYELARKGEEVKRKKQQVTISNLDLLGYKYPEMKLRVECSSGTYIRSLIHDIGQDLKTGALVTQLRRTRIGPYLVDRAVGIDDISESEIKKHFLDINVLRKHLSKYLFPEF